VAVDSAGILYIADGANNRIRKVSNGTITTVAGNGNFGFSGDGGPATSASFNGPAGVAVDSAGILYIADLDNGRIREVLVNPPFFGNPLAAGERGQKRPGSRSSAWHNGHRILKGIALLRVSAFPSRYRAFQ